MRTVPQAPPHLAYNFLTPSSPTAPAMDIALDSLETPTLTKAQLAEELFDNIGLNKREAKDMVDAFFNLVVQELVDGRDVKISGFGNFQLRAKSPRPGRNPRTGELISIDARRVVTFHASHKLKSVVQGEDLSALDAAEGHE